MSDKTLIKMKQKELLEKISTLENELLEVRRLAESNFSRLLTQTDELKHVRNSLDKLQHILLFTQEKADHLTGYIFDKIREEYEGKEATIKEDFSNGRIDIKTYASQKKNLETERNAELRKLVIEKRTPVKNLKRN